MNNKIYSGCFLIGNYEEILPSLRECVIKRNIWGRKFNEKISDFPKVEDGANCLCVLGHSVENKLVFAWLAPSVYAVPISIAIPEETFKQLFLRPIDSKGKIVALEKRCGSYGWRGGASMDSLLKELKTKGKDEQERWDSMIIKSKETFISL